MKVVVNRCFGGFGLSSEGFVAWAMKENMDGWKLAIDDMGFPGFNKYHLERENASRADGVEWFTDRDIPRDNLNLISVVEELGEKSFGRYARLEVVEIPDGIEWEIDEYDGSETVEEAHRSW